MVRKIYKIVLDARRLKTHELPHMVGISKSAVNTLDTSRKFGHEKTVPKMGAAITDNGTKTDRVDVPVM